MVFRVALLRTDSRSSLRFPFRVLGSEGAVLRARHNMKISLLVVVDMRVGWHNRWM